MHPFYGPSSEFLSQSSYWWIGLVSMVLYLVFWAVVIVIAVRLLKKYFISPEGLNKRGDIALEILRARYARGEINAEEFKRIKADLEENE